MGILPVRVRMRESLAPRSRSRLALSSGFTDNLRIMYVGMLHTLHTLPWIGPVSWACEVTNEEN